MRKNVIDILITDIQIPKNLESSHVDLKGGQHLIENILLRSDLLSIPKSVVGITSHEDSIELCKGFFLENSFHLIHSSDIDRCLPIFFKNFLIQFDKEYEQVDVAIITALRHTEFEAVMNLDAEWSRDRYSLGPIHYKLGSFKDKEGERRKILACSCSSMGSVSSATTTSMVIGRFNPQVVIMVGIAAGVEGKANIGDIVVADSTWEYESGKRTKENGEAVFQPSSRRVNIQLPLKTKMAELSFDEEVLKNIYNQCTVPGKPLNIPSLIVGPMVSGASVLEDVDIIKGIKLQDRKVVAIEMEAYGVAFACESSEHIPTCLIVKSVCDLANLDKNDDHQHYAAYTSAELSFHFLQKIHDFN